MKFAKGDFVQLTRDYTNKKGTIPAGTSGKITEVLATLFCYKINFNQQYNNVTVPEFDLKKA